jgi:hypothetical protein
MNEFTTSLITILFFIGVGYLAKHTKLLDVDVTKKLYKFLFTIPLPILVFTSLVNTNIEGKFLILPLIGSIISISLVCVSYIIGRALRLERKKLGTLMIAAGITSTLSFALPFISVFYGQEATKYLFLYDFGGAIIVWTFVYFIGGVMGNKRGQKLGQSILTFIKNPMIWALLSGLILAVVGFDLPVIFDSVSNKISGLTNPLILIGIGIFLNLGFFKQKQNLFKIILGITIVMGVSITLAFGLTTLFGIDGVMQKVVLISALAPAGALTVPFTAEHDLDTDYASALVASTMFLAILLVPILVAI